MAEYKGREVAVPSGLTIYDVTAPSDRAHLRLKGEHEAEEQNTNATKAARAAAFAPDSVEDVKDGDSEEVDEDPDAGVGQGPRPQTEAEAVEAEKKRREEMSEVELAEAEDRDGFARRFSGDDAEVPQVGSPDDPSRADQNDLDKE